MFSPGLLGLVATGALFGLAARIWWFNTYVDPRPELDFLAGPAIFFFAGLGLIVGTFATGSIILGEHRSSGGVVLAGSLLAGLVVIPFSPGPGITDTIEWSALTLASSLGILGGLKGIYWGKSWTDRAAIPELARPSSWAIIGGVILFISAPWYFERFVGLLSLVVPVSGAFVYKGIGNPRLLGLGIIISALFSFGSITEPTLNLAGILLSIVAGLKMVRWKPTALALHDDQPTVSEED